MDMKKLVAHFGSQKAVAEALGVSPQVVSAWNKSGIPIGRQYEIQIATNGALRADKIRRGKAA